MIVGYESDIAPTSGSPNLQQITVYDPEPHNVGSQSTMAAGIWYSTKWAGPVQYSGTWHNQYVAVIEPPVEKGRVKVKIVERTGKKIILPEEAIRFAEKAIKELKLAEKPAYAILRRKGVRNLQPILVREEIKPGLEMERGVPHYYIVPFGLEHETGECGVGLARLSVIVNAHTGRFEEIGAFGQPIRYLPEKEAINAVARAFGLKDGEMRDAQVMQMFVPSDITHIRIYPFWRVRVRGRVLYVDQLGKLYDRIKPSMPGD